MTYVLYIILEIPSNLILKAATPRIWIPLLLTLWGLVATFQGFSKSPGGFYVARLMLGASEAGILPALALWLTFFYHGHELMLRQSLYFSGSTLSGAFSGLLSTVLGRIHTSNYHGWPFIFFVRSFIPTYHSSPAPRSGSTLENVRSKRSAHVADFQVS